MTSTFESLLVIPPYEPRTTRRARRRPTALLTRAHLLPDLGAALAPTLLLAFLSALLAFFASLT